MSICMLDNESIIAKHCSLLSSRERLQKLIPQIRMSLNAGESGGDGSADGTLQATNDLIDYISAVFARLITQTAIGLQISLPFYALKGVPFLYLQTISLLSLSL